MAEKHFMADVLGWVIEGITVQMQDHGNWIDSSPDAVLRSIANRNRGREHYRQKPPTFMLNGFEINLPMTAEQAAAHEGLAFIPSLAGEQDYISVADKKSEMFKKAVRYRMLFAQPEDAARAGRALIQVMVAAIPIEK